MNKIILFIKASILTTAAFSSTQVFAETYKNRWGYFVFDVLHSTMKMDKTFGGNIFAKSAPGINLSFGKSLNDYFGLEVGYEIMKKKDKSTLIYNGVEVLGDIVRSEYEYYKSTIKRTKPYLGITSTFPIKNYGFVQVLVGAALVNIKATSTYIRDDLRTYNETINYKTHKVVPTLRVSLGKDVAKNFGVKASISWAQTRNIQSISCDQGGFRLQPKDTINIGVGLAYYL